MGFEIAKNTHKHYTDELEGNIICESMVILIDKELKRLQYKVIYKYIRYNCPVLSSSVE